MNVAAGRDRLEAEAERQQQSHQHSSSDMQMSMSGNVPSSAATTAMRTSKDGEPIATQPGTNTYQFNRIVTIIACCDKTMSQCEKLYSLCAISHSVCAVPRHCQVTNFIYTLGDVYAVRRTACTIP